MTRQKKEIIKKIDNLEQWIEVDVELGCGFAPAGAYDETYREIDRLREELAQLQHYANVEDMLYDTRAARTADAPGELNQNRIHRSTSPTGLLLVTGLPLGRSFFMPFWR